MKKGNVLYWVLTVLFCALMTISAVPDILRVPEAVTMVQNHLGYPPYFLQYIGWWKVLGVIGILQPWFPRIKEWAFAGIAFDLISAMYSTAAVGDPVSAWAPISIGLIFLAIVYTLHHKRLALSGSVAAGV